MSYNTIYFPSTEGPGDLRYVSVDPSGLYEFYLPKMRAYLGYAAIALADALVDSRIDDHHLDYYCRQRAELARVEELYARIYSAKALGHFSGCLVRSTDVGQEHE